MWLTPLPTGLRFRSGMQNLQPLDNPLHCDTCSVNVTLVTLEVQSMSSTHAKGRTSIPVCEGYSRQKHRPLQPPTPPLPLHCNHCTSPVDHKGIPQQLGLEFLQNKVNTATNHPDAGLFTAVLVSNNRLPSVGIVLLARSWWWRRPVGWLGKLRWLRHLCSWLGFRAKHLFDWRVIDLLFFLLPAILL